MSRPREDTVKYDNALDSVRLLIIDPVDTAISFNYRGKIRQIGRLEDSTLIREKKTREFYGSEGLESLVESH